MNHRHQSPGLLLYRSAPDLRSARAPGGFWAVDAEYCRYLHPSWPLYKGWLAGGKGITLKGSPSRRVLSGLSKQGYDYAVFDAWDWDTHEVVVLVPEVMRGVEEVR